VKMTHNKDDAQHSFMLALIVPELANQLRPDLNVPLVTQFALVHDLVELQTGDVVTFTLSEEALEIKEKTEQRGLQCLIHRLPPYTADMLRRYEVQQEPEARFVRLADKMLPLVTNIHGAGVKVMNEDFDITTTEQLRATEDCCSQRLRLTFPENELLDVHAVRDMLATRFERVFDADA
jgi:5'-deoxynucleotidase YfbR-like HD superfamily hydrolase